MLQHYPRKACAKLTIGLPSAANLRNCEGLRVPGAGGSKSGDALNTIHPLSLCGHSDCFKTALITQAASLSRTLTKWVGVDSATPSMRGRSISSQLIRWLFD